MIRNIFIAITVFVLVAESAALNKRTQKSVDTCGVSEGELGLIVRGQSFPRGTFPWIVALMHTGTRPPKYFCGGTLISKNFVISAAHCVRQKHKTDKLQPKDVLAIFGAHDLGACFEAERVMLTPKNIFVHDDWNPLTIEYDADISLLKFEEGSIHFNTFVQPVCLWDSEDDPTATDGLIVGWGKSEDETKIHENLPKLIKAPIQTNENCFLNTKVLVDFSSNRTFCAGLRNGSGVCTGDSGGGLFIKVDGVYHLKGIVSSSFIKDVGCDVSRNAIYTNVLKFNDWIRDKTGGETISSTNQRSIWKQGSLAKVDFELFFK